MKKNNESAFPIFLQDGLSSESHVDAGLTKREWFAGMAMQGFIAAGSHGMPDTENIVKYAIDTADAILKELDKF